MATVKDQTIQRGDIIQLQPERKRGSLSTHTGKHPVHVCAIGQNHLSFFLTQLLVEPDPYNAICIPLAQIIVAPKFNLGHTQLTPLCQTVC